MPTFLKSRRHRFDALHTLLTGGTAAARSSVPANLRRDVGLPETPETGALPLFDIAHAAIRRRD